MWILPNGSTINRPRDIIIGDILHPRQIFALWSVAQLAEIGVRPFRESTYDRKFYKNAETLDALVDGEIVRTHYVEPKYTGKELKAWFIKNSKEKIRTLWNHAVAELDYLGVFDSGNTEDIALWQQYKVDLRQAVLDAKVQMQSISNYEDGVEFVKRGFNSLLPAPPDQPVFLNEEDILT